MGGAIEAALHGRGRIGITLSGTNSLIHPGELNESEYRCRPTAVRRDNRASTRSARRARNQDSTTREAGTASRASPRPFRLPTDAQSTRRSTYSLWSSSPFPRLLIDELAAPPLCYFVSAARRCVQYRKQRATRYSTADCARQTAATAARSAGNDIFVSGMYRNDSLTPAPIVERRDAIAGLDGRIRPAGAPGDQMNECFKLENRAAAQAGGAGISACKPGVRQVRPSRAITNENRFARYRAPKARHSSLRHVFDVRFPDDRNGFDSSVKIPTGSHAARGPKSAVKTSVAA